MQPKKRTYKPVPPPAKICSFLAGRSGYGLTAILVAMLAAAMLVVPLTRWFLGMSAGTEDLQTKLMIQTIAKDKWDEIHAETFDDLAAALAANPSPWTEYIGDGNRWKIETTIGGEGKYVNAACADGTAGATDRKCRKVSIQVTDTMTGMTQAVNLAKVDSEFFNSRMKALETSIATAQSTADAAKSAAATAQSTADTAKANAATAQSTANTAKTNAATAQSTANTANTNANSALSKFGSYYTAAQVDSKISSSSSSGATQRVWVATDTCNRIELFFKNGLFQRISGSNGCGD